MPKTAPVIIVHDLAGARAALRAGREAGSAVTLRSAPDAARYAGLGFLRAVFDAAAEAEPDAAHTVVIDAGNGAALAHEAFRQGFRHVAFAGPKAMRAKLAAIAAAEGGTLLGGAAPRGALDLLDSRTPLEACRAFFATTRG